MSNFDGMRTCVIPNKFYIIQIEIPHLRSAVGEARLFWFENPFLVGGRDGDVYEEPFLACSLAERFLRGEDGKERKEESQTAISISYLYN